MSEHGGAASTLGRAFVWFAIGLSGALFGVFRFNDAAMTPDRQGLFIGLWMLAAISLAVGWFLTRPQIRELRFMALAAVGTGTLIVWGAILHWR